MLYSTGKSSLTARPVRLSRGRRGVRFAVVSSYLEDALRMLFVGVDSRLHSVHHRFIDHQLTVVTKGDLEAVHRTRRRAFEIQAADEIAGSVAWAFEFLLGGQPSRRASQMGAFGEDRVEAAF